jgi:hypothetical protein
VRVELRVLFPRTVEGILKKRGKVQWVVGEGAPGVDDGGRSCTAERELGSRDAFHLRTKGVSASSTVHWSKRHPSFTPLVFVSLKLASNLSLPSHEYRVAKALIAYPFSMLQTTFAFCPLTSVIARSFPYASKHNIALIGLYVSSTRTNLICRKCSQPSGVCSSRCTAGSSFSNRSTLTQ